jgi:hypothetical protein
MGASLPGSSATAELTRRDKRFDHLVRNVGFASNRPAARLLLDRLDIESMKDVNKPGSDWNLWGQRRPSGRIVRHCPVFIPSQFATRQQASWAASLFDNISVQLKYWIVGARICSGWRSAWLIRP